MNEIDYERMQEDAAIGQAIAANLQLILDEFGESNVADLSREIYKRYECGPWLSVQLHDGTWKHTDDLLGIDNGNVRALRVGSIVEGSDAEVNADPIDLWGYMDEGDEKRLIDDFSKAISWVNDEACSLFNETNQQGD